MIDLSEIKSDLARKYYSEDQNCLSDFIEILDEYEKVVSPQNLPKVDAYSMLAEARKVLGDIVEGNYRIFEPDSMDINRSLHKQINELYKKVSEHFS